MEPPEAAVEQRAAPSPARRALPTLAAVAAVAGVVVLVAAARPVAPPPRATSPTTDPVVAEMPVEQVSTIPLTADDVGGEASPQNGCGPVVGSYLLSSARLPDGRQMMFARGLDASLQTRTWRDGAWADPQWTALAGFLGSAPDAAAWADGTVHVVGLPTCGGTEIVRRTRRGGSWGSWTSLKTPTLPAYAPAVVAPKADALAAAYVDTKGDLYVADSPAGADWQSWVKAGSGLTGAPELTANADGGLQVYARDSAGRISLLRRAGATWSTIGTLPPAPVQSGAAPVAVPDGNGLRILVISDVGELTARCAADGSNCGPWARTGR